MRLIHLWTWINSHLLVALALGITFFLIYHYFVERDRGIRLSKKYRNSVFETQSKIFLNATQYLISGNKDLAIREFLNAVDLNSETLDTYFALGELFRSNGEIDKAISIHRSLISREDISESVRVKSLKELALDFDKGGFLDNAIETYKDVLKVNRDQVEVITSLCRIYEDIGDWDQAYKYRIMLSKVGLKNQAETIAHILVQKAMCHYDSRNFLACAEELSEAFKFFPSVSGKILQLKLYLALGDIDQSQGLLIEVLKEHPMFASFLFECLHDTATKSESSEIYKINFQKLRDFFLFIEDKELIAFPSVVLTRIRLLKEAKKVEEAYKILKNWMSKNSENSEALKIEYIKLSIALGKDQEALKKTAELLENFHNSLTKHYCRQCGYNSDSIFWRCPQCHDWETIQFTWKV